MSYTFVKLPKQVLYDSSITAESQRLFAIIIDLSNSTGFCWATNGYLAKKMDCSTSSVSRSLRELKEKGYIRTMDYSGNKKSSRHIFPNF